jgi:hypothetical protein
MNETSIITIITIVAGSLAGLAAVIKATREVDKSKADAGATIVSSAADVVEMLREQMSDMKCRLDNAEERLLLLEKTVGTWEAWAEHVLDILDRALGMMAEEQRNRLTKDVEEVRRTRPPRSRSH